METWYDAIEALLEEVLEDDDFLLDKLADRPPAIGSAVKAMANIPPDYFSEPAPEPNQDESQHIIVTLRKLVGKTGSDDTPKRQGP